MDDFNTHGLGGGTGFFFQFMTLFNVEFVNVFLLGLSKSSHFLTGFSMILTPATQPSWVLIWWWMIFSSGDFRTRLFWQLLESPWHLRSPHYNLFISLNTSDWSVLKNCELYFITFNWNWISKYFCCHLCKLQLLTFLWLTNLNCYWIVNSYHQHNHKHILN